MNGTQIMENAIAEILTAVFTVLFAYIGYLFSRKKSRCAECEAYLPVNDLRWVSTATDSTTGKLAQVSYCNECIQKASNQNYNSIQPEVNCIRCRCSLESISHSIQDVGKDKVHVCDTCMQLAPKNRVMLQDLLSNEFLQSCSSFDSFADIQHEYKLPLRSEEDLHSESFNVFIATHSTYTSFQTMLNAAIENERISLLRNHLELD